MQGDSLLQYWKKAKYICQQIITISKNANLYNKIPEVRMYKQTNEQFRSVYDIVYRLCTTKYKYETRVAMVYKDFKDILKIALIYMCQGLEKEKNIYKLIYLRKIWYAYNDILKRMVHMFAYVNRPFHIKYGRIEYLEKTGFGIAVTTLLNEQALIEYYGIYFREIDNIRKTNDFSFSQSLKDFVEILYKIHLKLIKSISKKANTIYTEFHKRYLSHSKAFYYKKYVLIKYLNPGEYFYEVNRIYLSEVKIGAYCFGIGGDTLTNQYFATYFITKYRKILMYSPNGLKSIMQHRQTHTLKIIIEMYTKLTHNIEGFKEQFSDYIFEDFKKYMYDIKNYLLIKKNINAYCQFISKIIDKNNEYLEMLQKSFMHIADFIASYKSGVEKAFAVVKLPVTIEEILTIFVDTKLKFNSVYETDLYFTIKNIMSIFICLQNKDLFLMKYTQKVAKKLLLATPYTIKNNELFVENLKLNCGIKFTYRIYTLIYEYNLHEEYSALLKNISSDMKLSIDFNVKIFSEGAWPTSTIIDIPLHYFPLAIEKASQCLNIYNTQHKSKFRWTYYFEEEVENKFPECYFDTNCLQGAILWLIYTKRPYKISLKLIEHYFGKVPHRIIKESVLKMSDSNYNILIKKTDEDDIFFTFNQKMKSTKRLINYETGVNTEEEKLFQYQDLGRDREIVLDANIAKFMKSKKVIDFYTLFIEIAKMIKTFSPQKKDIKIAVERLIGKELLQRDYKDLNKIRYID